MMFYGCKTLSWTFQNLIKTQKDGERKDRERTEKDTKKPEKISNKEQIEM